jgi:hypothetical protein
VSPIPDTIKLSDLHEELERQGLHLSYAEWPLGEKQPVAYLAPIQTALPGIPPVEDKPQPDPRPRKANKLALRIVDLLQAANLHPGDVKTTMLGKGLRIDVMVHNDGTTRLMLARKNIYPSDQEWSTVLAYWPYDIPLEVEPDRFTFKEWFCLRGVWMGPEVQP